MALLLSCARKTCFYTRAVKGGDWNVQLGVKMHRIRGKTLGLIGFGQNGRAMVPKAKGFGLEVIAYDPFVADEEIRAAGARAAELDELLESADFVSLHLPLTPATRHFLTADSFRKMKPTAYVINTARGAVIDTNALAEAINQGEIAGAGLDVLPSEPPAEDDPILRLDMVVLSPHAAFTSIESILDLQRLAAENIAAVLAGRRAPHIVNTEVLESPALRARLLS
jgi:D-3-phosphoglycerate dehydrogenase